MPESTPLPPHSAGAVRQQFVHLIDLMPTILEATGVPAPTMRCNFARAPFSTSHDCFSVGTDLGNRVSPACAAPFPFAGTIERVRIEGDASALSPVETMRFNSAMAPRV